MPRKKRYNISAVVPLHKCCDTSIDITIDPFCGGGAAPANICAISNRLCDASSFNLLINSQIDGCVCLNMVGKTSVPSFQIVTCPPKFV